MPVIKAGARDADTNYAVTALAGNLAAKEYPGKNPAVIKDVIGGVTNAANRGVFTSGLEKQVKKFQAANGLKDDGIVGPGTWKALGLKSERRASVPSAPAETSIEKKSEEKIVETKITDKVWFWPAVALVGVGAATTGVIVYKRRRAAAS
jgi:peptidoglycan hydrolase-like protein with peptidoglycan-binding domain